MLTEPVVFWQALGLAGAIVLHLAFLGAARLLAGDRWPLAYPALIIAASSLLTWQGLFEARWSAPIAALALIGAAITDLRLNGLPRIRWPAGAVVLAGAALVFNAFWAAFPEYRYDQWNDHLVIPKILVSDGPLEGPVFNDHIFFTGSYEFLLTIPRWVSTNDVFNQCFANAFGWLLLWFGTWGSANLFRRVLLPTLPSPLLIACYASFALPEEQAIMNAKPDVVLFVAGLVLQAGIGLLDTPAGRSPVSEALVGFLLVAPLAMKSTWLLCAFAIVGAVLLTGRVWRTEMASTVRRGWIWVGVALGALAVVPYVAKNIRFFGNPLHPVQFGPFRSDFWGPALEGYYRAVEGARSIERYGAQLALAPRVLLMTGLEALAVPLLALALGLAVALRASAAPGDHPRDGALGGRAAAALLLYVLLWPIAMPVGIHPRYYYAIYSFITVMALQALAWAWPLVRLRRPARLAMLVLLLSVPAIRGDFVTKGARMLDGAFTETRQFVGGPGPMGSLLSRLQTVNEHRRRRFPGARFGTRIALTDTVATYFLDSASLAVGGREYLSHLQWTGATCGWQLLDRLGVAYVVSIQQPLRLWPPEITTLLPDFTRLDEAGRVFFVEPDLVHRKAQDDPACKAARQGPTVGS